MDFETYKDRPFKINDALALLRDPETLFQPVLDAAGNRRTIPNGTMVRLDDVRVIPGSAGKVILYVHALAADTGAVLGWTSSINIAGMLLGETLGFTPAPGGGTRFGPHAAWENDAYLGQIGLVTVVGTEKELKFIAESTAGAFVAMVAAARADGLLLGLNSGFRSWPEQKALHDGFVRKLNGFAPANRPGNSNHQNGVAFDIDTNGVGTPTYQWLSKNATAYGFVRTVRKEAWHWEYRPQAAARARSRNVCTIWD